MKKEKFQDLAMSFFSAKTEKRIMTGFYMYVAAVVLIQVTRLIIQNF